MNGIAADRLQMTRMLSSLTSTEGAQPSPVDGVALLRVSKSYKPVQVLYEPCVVIVAQGHKRFHFPDKVLKYDAGNYLVVTVPVPADCETIVGGDGPFLGIAVRIDLRILDDLLVTLGPVVPPRNIARADVKVCTPPMNASISNVSLRLVESMMSPSDAKVLGPQLVREFFYRVLCDSAGDALRNLVLGSEGRTQVHRILQRMHDNYASTLNLATLAHEVGMSSSALHQHFKAVTGTSPTRYLKTLRLHKARMLMVQHSFSAAVVAERVGYVSPSQFSREFKRLFGAPPADEANRVRIAVGFTDQVSLAS